MSINTQCSTVQCVQCISIWLQCDEKQMNKKKKEVKKYEEKNQPITIIDGDVENEQKVLSVMLT